MPDTKHPGHGGQTLHDTHPSLTQETPAAVPAVTETPTPVRNSKVGDIVNYVLPTGRSKGEVRPAIIVRKWGESPESAVQLQVFTDSINDYEHLQQHGNNGLMWATSVAHNESEKSPGTWHFTQD
jgi:hypothetical protein